MDVYDPHDISRPCVSDRQIERMRNRDCRGQKKMALAANATNMFKEELKSLTNTQDSISEVSTLMLIQWRYAKELVGVWGSQFEKAKDVKKVLALLYLAHEILMKAHKKKKTNILDAFADV